MDCEPKCIIITGRPGAGKTTLAGKLCKLLHMPLLSRDEIKEGYVNSFGISHENLPDDTNMKVNALFFSATQMFLEAKVSTVVEAAFQHRVWQTIVPHWESVSSIYILICETDPEVCAQRHLARGLSDDRRTFYHGDPRVVEFKRSGEFLPPGKYVPPNFNVPTLKVNTAEGYSPNLEEIMDYLQQ